MANHQTANFNYDWMFQEDDGSMSGLVGPRGEFIPVLKGNSGVPETPTNVFAVAGDGQATVYFNPSIRATSYQVIASTGQTVTTTVPFAVFPGLLNGLQVSFTVVASANGILSAPSVASNSISPTTLPGLSAGTPNVLALFDADQLPVVSNGTALSFWADLSGNGWHASQATSTQQPTYVTSANWGSGASGHAAVKFDGASSNGDSLVTALSPALFGPDLTVICVVSLTSLTNGAGAGDMRILSCESVRYDRGFCLTTNSGSTGAGSGTNYFSCKGGTSEVNSSSPDLLVANTPFIGSVVTGKQHFKDGTRYIPQLGTIAAILPRSQGLVIGNIIGNNLGQGIAASIPYMLITRGPMADFDRNRIEAALGLRYNISPVATNPTV